MNEEIKVSELDAVDEVRDTDVIMEISGGANKKATIQQVKENIVKNEYGTATNRGYSQNYLNGKIVAGSIDYSINQLQGDLIQNGEPTPTSPISVQVVKGNNSIVITDSSSTQTLSLNLGSIELCKIGNYTDYIYKNGNKWYKHSAIKKRAFTGQESFTKVSEGFYFQVTDLSLTINRTIFCNDYKNYLTYSPFVGSDYGISFLYNNSQLYIRDKDVSTVSALQTKLVNNNVVMYYILNTATDIEITDTTLLGQLNNIESAINSSLINITQTPADLPIKISLNINTEF